MYRITPRSQSFVLKCDTNFDENFIEFAWTINNFSSLPDTREIFSPVFSSLIKMDYQWRLHIVPKNNDTDVDDCEYLSIFLEALNLYDKKVNASTVFYIRNSKTQCIKAGTCLYDSKIYNWGFDDFIKYSDLVNEKYLVNDTLRIWCKFAYSAEEINCHVQDVLYFGTDDLNGDICKFVKLLHGNERFSDICLEVGETKFHLHKFVLSSRSSVFAAMFKFNMKEQNVIKIEEIELEVMKQMISFIYTDSVDDIESHTIELLKAADMYDMKRLKIMCEDSLCNSLSMDNVAELVEFADMYKAQKLKKKAIQFIQNNLSKLIQTPDFLHIPESKSCLIDIMKSLNIK